jgi:hypothetical protein
VVSLSGKGESHSIAVSSLETIKNSLACDVLSGNSKTLFTSSHFNFKSVTVLSTINNLPSLPAFVGNSVGVSRQSNFVPSFDKNLFLLKFGIPTSR